MLDNLIGGFMENVKVAVIYYSARGTNHQLAQWAKELGTAGTVLRKRWDKYQTLLPIQRTKDSYRAKQNRNSGRG